jgi:hypothetical protein
VNGFPILLVLALVPLVGAIAIAALPRDRELLAKQLALVFSLATLAVTIGICVAFEPGSGERFQFATSYEWISSFGTRCRPWWSRRGTTRIARPTRWRSRRWGSARWRRPGPR